MKVGGQPQDERFALPRPEFTAATSIDRDNSGADQRAISID